MYDGRRVIHVLSVPDIYAIISSSLERKILYLKDNVGEKSLVTTVTKNL